MQLRFKKLQNDVVLPEFKKGNSGGDIRASKPYVIRPGSTVAVSTGLSYEIDDVYEIQVRPRSGLAFKYGITVANAPGTLDASYRGEIKVMLINHSDCPFKVEVGDRIAQLVVAEVTIPDSVVEVAELSETFRGSDGFGSSGVK